MQERLSSQEKSPISRKSALSIGKKDEDFSIFSPMLSFSVFEWYNRPYSVCTYAIGIIVVEPVSTSHGCKE